MGLLEKLRPQPKWKHTDPTVRLEALHEIDDGDQAPLIALATDDADARVRRAALARVDDLSTLAAIVRNDNDETTREQALARIAQLAEAGAEALALNAVGALASLSRQRELATVARSSTSAAVRIA